MPRGKYARLVRLSALACFLLCVALAATWVDARAGGGQGYSGGGGGGGHGGGGGDGGGIIWLIYWLIRLCIDVPIIGIPLLLIVVGFLIYAWYNGKNSLDASTIRKASAARDASRQPEMVDAIRQADPAFDADQFLGRVTHAFVQIQQAWSAQDLTPVRPFISDAVHERFSLQFEEQKALGYRNQMDAVNVEQASIVHTSAGNVFDGIAIRIQATANDRAIDLQSGKVVPGRQVQDPRFVEVWSFLRRRGASTTPGKPGLMEGSCPNCGAKIEMNQNANCQYCGALLRSGQYDWVLVEITQEYEWETPGLISDVPGAATLTTRDPEFNIQELEDRASVVFWRRAAAARLDSSKPIRRVALPQVCEAFDTEAAKRKGKPRTYYGECAVGAVNVVGVIPSGGGNGIVSEDGYDRALVEVRWSGKQFSVTPDGRATRGAPSAVSYALLVLCRKSQTRSDPDKSVSSAHCPNCGAPESGGAAGTCNFCGATLNDGSKTWTLEEAAAMHSDRGRALVAAAGDTLAPSAYDDGGGTGVATIPLAPPPVPTRAAAAALAKSTVLGWMVKMMLADGQIDAKEEAMLRAAANSYGVPMSRLQDMIASARAGSLYLIPPANQDEAQEHLKAMARIALADGKISSEEYGLLRTTGQGLGLSEYDIKQLLKQTQSEMLGEARQTLRDAKARRRI